MDLYRHTHIWLHWCFWRCWISAATWTSSGCREQGWPQVAVFGLPTVVASLVGERGLQACGPQRFPLAGFRAQVPYLRQKRLVALQRVGSSWISCVGRWTPPHWATREAPAVGLYWRAGRSSKVFSSKLEVKIREEHKCSRKTATRYSSCFTDSTSSFKSIGAEDQSDSMGKFKTPFPCGITTITSQDFSYICCTWSANSMCPTHQMPSA